MDKPLDQKPTDHALTHLRPEQQLGQMLPAIHLVRTNWLVRLVGKVTFGMLVVALVCMIFLPWQQSARGNGMVVARNPQQRPQTLGSPTDGVVKQVRRDLIEGAIVTKDEVILEIEPFAPDELNQVQSQFAQLEAKRDATKIALDVAEQNVSLQELNGVSTISSGLKDVEAASKKWEQQKNEVQVLQAELKQKQYEKKQAEALFPKSLISEVEYNSKLNAYDQAVSKLEKGQAMVQEFFNALNSKENELEAKRKELQIKNGQARAKLQEERQKIATVEKELSEISVKLGSLGRLRVSSPVDGVLHEIFGIEGSKTVKKGDSLFTVVPQVTDIAVSLNVPGRDMPLIHVGDKVRLQFEGWPAVQFVGWPSVAVGTFGGRIVALSPTDDTRGNFSVLVAPDPEEPQWPDNRYLRQGVRATGWIMLKQVSLGYEVWRQLNGFPPVISDQEPGKGYESSEKGKEGKKVKLPKM